LAGCGQRPVANIHKQSRVFCAVVSHLYSLADCPNKTTKGFDVAFLYRFLRHCKKVRKNSIFRTSIVHFN
jgi:hypothetical protein